MKRMLLFILAAAAVLSITSCGRGISPEQAANGKAKCGRYIR